MIFDSRHTPLNWDQVNSTVASATLEDPFIYSGRMMVGENVVYADLIGCTIGDYGDIVINGVDQDQDFPQTREDIRGYEFTIRFFKSDECVRLTIWGVDVSSDRDRARMNELLTLAVSRITDGKSLDDVVKEIEYQANQLEYRVEY